MRRGGRERHMLGHMRQVVLYPDREDGGWIAEVPTLPGCVGDGDTREEAIESARQAIALWIEAAREHGDPIPVEDYAAAMVLVSE